MTRNTGDRMAEHVTHRRPRRAARVLYEIDAIRAVTAICVVGVHAVSFTLILTHTNAGQLRPRTPW